MRMYHDAFMKLIDENKETIERKMKENPDFLNSLLSDLTEETSKKIFKSLDKSKSSMLRRVRKENKKYNRRLYKTWKIAFDNYETIIELVTEAAQIYVDNFRSVAEQDNNMLFYALRNIHARAVLISKECLVLFKNGYPDGAYSLWRTLYELFVIATFLVENKNSDICERYLNFVHIQAYKEENICREKGYPSHTEESFKNLKKNYDSMITKYGDKYKAGDYGWANDILNKERVTFKDIEDNVDLSKFRGYYMQSSSFIHGNMKASIDPIGLIPGSTRLLLVGPSNYGLSIPMQNVVISLVNISILFLLVYPTIDTMASCYIMQNFMEIVLKEADSIQVGIEDREEKLNKKGNKTIEN